MLHAKGKNLIEIHCELLLCMANMYFGFYQWAANWYWFCVVYAIVEYPCSSTIEDKALIQDDRWCKLYDVAVETWLLVVHEILHEKLGYWKVLSSYVPKEID